MAANENSERAKTAFAAVDENLRRQHADDYETAIAVGLVGIGHALLAIAEEIGRAIDRIGRSDPESKRRDV
jgi:hypothetical protein